LILAIPVNLFAGHQLAVPVTDISGSAQVTAYYDLRDRNSLIQVTNSSNSPVFIHVQIFQHDRGCDELNFFDSLTANDTVVYDMDNIIKNDGSAAPINLQDDSYGYVVISTDSDGLISTTSQGGSSLIGNVRIVDIQGDYEYRANLSSTTTSNRPSINEGNLIAHFNTVDDAKFADLIGYGIAGRFISTVINLDAGIDFDIFVFDMDEEPLSCDRRNFACGIIMNYGINEDYTASRGSDLICSGGGLANPNGGFISFEEGDHPETPQGQAEEQLMGPFNETAFLHYIGLNNGDGTGSFDTWIYDGD
ncbi:MAG: hypothetical protein GTO02_17755, partial [Candidatus Dadabacteria bacterium]|nr:hypothetical protein [Candidatus Dadabacteria bacterium]NIQ16163.1 hypothetical protein [Candidatus Dadabacteria bacterium]